MVDVAQIRNIEDMYRALDGHINCLLPYIGMQFENLNVQGLIFAIRTLQNNLDNKIITFYQPLPERELLKVVFSLCNFQNRLF